jgi:hypothetical protein
MKTGDIAFFLYLRPFASTGGVQVVRSISRRRRRGLVVRWNDLEALLTRYLEPYGPLIGLGRPGEQVGAGRIPSDEESWQKLVATLAANARLLFLLPAADSGTRWEMDLVFSQPELLGKTIFIVPGSARIDDYVQATAPLPGMQKSTNVTKWEFQRDWRYRELSKAGAAKDLTMGARKNPERSSEKLRLEALECLRATGAPAAAAWAERSPNGGFIMLDPQLRLRDAHPLRGRIGDLYAGSLYQLLWSGSFYELNLSAFRRTLAELIKDRQSVAKVGPASGHAGLASDLDEEQPCVDNAAQQTLDGELARLREYLDWENIPEWMLHDLRRQLREAERELPKVDPAQRPRVLQDLHELHQKVTDQERLLAAQRRTEHRKDKKP